MSTQSKETVKCRVVSATAAIVIVGNEFNVSIFNPHWLCKFEILQPEEIQEGAIFTPPLVNIPTQKFALVILPNRLQLSFQDVMQPTNEEFAERVLGGILQQLPHTPLLGIGINFDYFITPEPGSDFGEWNQANFASPIGLEVCSKKELKPRFGSYFSMDFEGMRLKIDVKPIPTNGIQAAPPAVHEALKIAPEWMHVALNYHKDLNSETGSKDAIETLAKYAAAVNHTNSVIKELVNS